MATTPREQSSSPFAGLTSPEVIKDTGDVLSSTPGTIVDVINPTSALRRPEVNAARCAIYFLLGYLIA